MMNFSGRSLQILKLVVLARLLSPADFGLLGIAMLTLAVLQRFSELGVDVALIQNKKENIDQYLNTAWTMQIVRGIAIAGVLFVIAPYVARFFNEPRTADIIRVMALLPLIIGFENPGIIYLEKNLEFHRRVLHALGGPVANVALSVSLALLWQNVWALVFGSLAGTVVTLIVSYRIHAFRPRPELSWEMARELYGYGKWITVSAIIGFLISQGDDAFVGWFLTASALGLYQMAYRLSNAPATEAASVVSDVVFPAYSQIQEDVSKLRKACYLTLQFVSIVSFPMAIGIMIIAPVFTRVILGDDWLPMVTAMQLLAVFGGLRAMSTTIRPMFDAVGRPDYNTKLNFLRLGIIVVLIYPATAAWGITGTGVSIVVAGLISTPAVFLLAVYEVDLALRELLRILFYPVVGSGVMGISVYYLRETLTVGAPAKLVILVCIGMGIYAATMLGIERKFDYGIEPLFKRIVGAFQ
jgi:PST family polysaccharide transporter/lipopolysaccharide exporter